MMPPFTTLSSKPEHSGDARKGFTVTGRPSWQTHAGEVVGFV
jgi:hypothetical protein